MTLREFVAYYEAYEIEAWDHTTAITVELHNFKATYSNTKGGKEKVQQFTEKHPLRGKSSNGIPINKKNFRVLKDIVKATVVQ